MYKDLSKDELLQLKAKLEKEYDDFKSKNLKLDMTRGKPCSEQLELSKGMLDLVNSNMSIKAQDGTDCLNYGNLDGLKECKDIFSAIFNVPNSNIIIGGNSSLTLMFDYISQCFMKGAGAEPWSKVNAKFLCPVPGYDRHFAICEYLGIEMINVPMTSQGPDMDVVEEYVKDPSVKGIFCVPKYSNPTGITFSDEVVKRFANMKTADDFRIIWDNAYCLHHLGDTEDKLLDILDECKKAGNPDRAVVFASTSKITFAGAGISALATSDNNIAMIKKRLSFQTIGSDKVNQLRHALFFKDIDGVKQHMKKHAGIVAPKFNLVLEKLDKELANQGIASWEKPNGGYFVSLDVLDGCAKRVYDLCAEGGVKLTNCGATFPYGKDPQDKNIRIAPTFPPIGELEQAVSLLCICVKLASIENYLNQN